MNSRLLSLLFVATLSAIVLSTNVEQEEIITPAFDIKIETTSVVAQTTETILPTANQPRPLITARVAAVKKINFSNMMFELNSTKQWPLASVSKLMTAIIALEKIGPNEIIPISAAAVATEGPQGGFSTGELFTIGDLVKSMMVVSSNDAPAAIAEFFGKQAFVKAMNEKATELQMTHTSFVDPIGFSLSNQSTTADLEKLVSYIYVYYPEIFSYSRQKEIEIIDLKSTIKRRLFNINVFAGEKEFLGGKTGYTDEASGNLVSLFWLDGQPLFIAVFGSENRFGDTKILYDWAKNNK
ncbi:MAG: serine hydrolase [Patescibacteria group bacterium]